MGHLNMQNDGHPGHAINSDTTHNRTRLLFRQSTLAMQLQMGLLIGPTVNKYRRLVLLLECGEEKKKLSCCHSGHHKALMDYL